MAFCDLFKEFIPIRVDENIFLRQHEPEKDARPFGEIYYDEENSLYFGGYRKPCDWNEESEIRVQQSRIKGFDGKREYSWVITYQEKVIGQIQYFISSITILVQRLVISSGSLNGIAESTRRH